MSRLCKCGGIASWLLVSCQTRVVIEEPAALRKLRADYAERFCEPLPHVALAKHYHDRGNHLVAFYVLDAPPRFSCLRAETIRAGEVILGVVQTQRGSVSVPWSSEHRGHGERGGRVSDGRLGVRKP